MHEEHDGCVTWAFVEMMDSQPVLLQVMRRERKVGERVEVFVGRAKRRHDN
jgi:hypothetical protein